MPTYAPNRREHVDTHIRVHDKAALSPTTPAVTGIEYPSPLDGPSEVDSNRYRGQMPRALYTHHNIASSTIDDVVDPPADAISLDQVWGTIRQEKERKMAKEKPKVQSLEEVARELFTPEQSPSIRIPVMQSQTSVPKSLKKQKSISNFRESTDGRSIVVTFDMPPQVAKQDVHLSFQRNRLIITWETQEVNEWEEDGIILRERVERSFHRTLPLPEGTRFEEIQAVMNDRDRRLVLRYPNMRCYRVEARSRSGES
ncbi:hypothetical protein BDQ12DRAFT_496417 [Crucibulum laeve]|uniref:SHSP domain-containing protein n=1 Tax=Crucibulum laeve TaxID=68775 RepID=A0A5C3MGY1_9AGAR|nr:hypothetical protein BDQ12DRAFT_496417 [Crucibulum laeve]